MHRMPGRRGTACLLSLLALAMVPAHNLLAGCGMLRHDLTVGSHPVAVLALDVNLDGRLDLVTADADSWSISVLLRQATGGYLRKAEVALPGVPRAMVGADFNGDGKPDLAVSVGFDSVVILYGDGAGGFTIHAAVTVGQIPQGLVVGDFNHDGRPDIAVANEASTSLSVILNLAAGFSVVSSPAAGVAPLSVTAGDFNGDGNLDLAVANSGSFSVSILLGNGAGSFILAHTI